MLKNKIKRKIYKLFHPPLGEVLMLHRVVKQRSTLEANQQMEITPEFLEKTIEYYCNRKKYDLISLDELYDRLQNRTRSKRKFVCFTLDDGYKDNYELAYPIFRKYNCPFTLYLSTDFPDKRALIWWYWLEDILIKVDQLQLGDGEIIATHTLDAKNQAFEKIRRKALINSDQHILKFFHRLLPQYYSELSNYVDRYALDWEEISVMSKDSICCIGSHTVSHPVLTAIDVLQLEKELLDSKALIENHIGRKVLHFAYPFGKYNEVVIEAVRKAGYCTSVIVNGGEIRNENRSLFEIKRILLREQ